MPPSPVHTMGPLAGPGSAVGLAGPGGAVLGETEGVARGEPGDAPGDVVGDPAAGGVAIEDCETDGDGRAALGGRVLQPASVPRVRSTTTPTARRPSSSWNPVGWGLAIIGARVMVVGKMPTRPRKWGSARKEPFARRLSARCEAWSSVDPRGLSISLIRYQEEQAHLSLDHPSVKHSFSNTSKQ
jgi:hypothetical protein